ncbi:MAG: DUF364 domain-containing protein, partial [Thermodesulfobacteriota bacterium]|nr:DUF364 domain-containing protein [Thermodesulfobacteriota bacterium]
GLSSTFQDDLRPHRPVRDVGNLTQKAALELAEYAKSANLLEASIGMAALNSLLDIDENRCEELNAFEILAEKGKDKSIAIVGHYPFISKLKKLTRKLWVIEKRIQEGDYPEEEAKRILPQADLVVITGTSFINHTIEKLLELCNESWVMVLGPTTPLSPILFEYGVDMIAGSRVVEPEKVIHCISEGATFQQVKGIKHLIMKR